MKYACERSEETIGKRQDYAQINRRQLTIQS